MRLGPSKGKFLPLWPMLTQKVPRKGIQRPESAKITLFSNIFALLGTAMTKKLIMFGQPDAAVPLRTQAQNSSKVGGHRQLGRQNAKYWSQYKPKLSKIVNWVHSGHIFTLCWLKLWLKMHLEPWTPDFCCFGPFWPPRIFLSPQAPVNCILTNELCFALMGDQFTKNLKRRKVCNQNSPLVMPWLINGSLSKPIFNKGILAW